MGAASVEVRTADAARPQEREAYDRVLVDPPCSDLGTLAVAPRRALAQGGGRARAAARAAGRRSCAPGAAAVRPGGTLVYSTCTIAPAENERVVDAFLAERPDFAADDLGSSEWSVWQHGRRPMFLQTLPHRDGTDGFFIARLRRIGCPHELRRRRPRRRLPGLRRAVAAADEAARPLPLRVLPDRFELMSVCPDCGEHSTIVRMSSTALYACKHCRGSMLKPI